MRKYRNGQDEQAVCAQCGWTLYRGEQAWMTPCGVTVCTRSCGAIVGEETERVMTRAVVAVAVALGASECEGWDNSTRDDMEDAQCMHVPLTDDEAALLPLLMLLANISCTYGYHVHEVPNLGEVTVCSTGSVWLDDAWIGLARDVEVAS